MIVIHPTARVHHLADLEASVRGTRIVIGARTTIDAFVKIKPTGGTGDVIIGEDCHINSGCVIYSGNGVTLGHHVEVAANCTLAPVNHAYQDRSRLISEQRFLPSKGGIEIHDDVWIGANTVLLDGVVLAQGCVIGASSLVRESVPAFEVWAGNPLRKLSERR
jgi:virginiamycin A acetyltransferase